MKKGIGPGPVASFARFTAIPLKNMVRGRLAAPATSREVEHCEGGDGDKCGGGAVLHPTPDLNMIDTLGGGAASNQRITRTGEVQRSRARGKTFSTSS
ncbi:hypothetical protein, partial [Streptomyces sp. NPDC056291]|uniref:hypothetical protein n=1 Tax=Streptomyces sp. NPDC056291 TaxID=3345772 RepID=UPI0035D7130C